MKLVLLVLAINLLAFVAHVLDKQYAREGRTRISEANLLLLALVGGSVGALAACYLVRHKTRKGSYLGPLWLILIGQAALLGCSLLFGPPAFIVEYLGAAG